MRLGGTPKVRIPLAAIHMDVHAPFANVGEYFGPENPSCPAVC
jgi:hypothetical protein